MAVMKNERDTEMGREKKRRRRGERGRRNDVSLITRAVRHCKSPDGRDNIKYCGGLILI